MGPQALRAAGLVQTLAQFGLDVKDCGNLSGAAGVQRSRSRFGHVLETFVYGELRKHATTWQGTPIDLAALKRLVK